MALQLMTCHLSFKYDCVCLWGPLRLTKVMGPPPIVTGLSPNEGPPGTVVKIRGENLGESPTDLIGVIICGFDCSLSAEWKSRNKIVARTGPSKGKGDVIVVTRSGGKGSCNVSFKGYHETIGPMKESAVWVEEAPLFAWGRHSLSPSSFQQDDPLGLSVEGNDKKIPEDDLLEFFPNKCGDITSEDFSPGWFLLENHHCTSFNDLQAGLLCLRRKVEAQKEGQLSFLKANITSVMDQIDTLVNLKERFHNDVQKYGTEPTLTLEKAIKESEREARRLYDDVLARRDRAEKTRNALNVLARFRFLFCLPCTIDRNLKKKEYDIIINDYIRVRNLFNKTEVPVFKFALNEIEKKVSGVQKMLHEKLTKMPINIEEQKRLIRYLVNLEAPFEPAWDAIKSHSDYINLRIKQCYDEHKATEAALISEENAKTKHSNSKFKYFPPKENTIPECILFVEELCEVVSELFPDLWKLGQAYFTGELHVKVEPGRQVEFKHMVMTVMDTFCKAIRLALMPRTLDKNVDKGSYTSWNCPSTDVLASWLPACLRNVRTTYSTLIKLDLPSEALDIVFNVILDLRIYCMNVLFKQQIDEVKWFHKRETWKIEFTHKHSGITNLPITFEQLIQDLVQIIKESLMSVEQREGSLLDNQMALKELNKQMETLLSAFHSVLDNLAFKDDNEGEDDFHAVSQLIGTTAHAYKSNSDSNTPFWEQRLLTTLSNCQYTRMVVFKNITELFNKSGFPPPKAPIDNVSNKLEMLEKSILDAYLEQKSDPLVGTIEPSMYLGRFDWDTKIVPADIRPYAKECIHNLINVHAEVNSISPNLLVSILPQIVQTIAEELYRVMSCVQKFSVAGIQQARADIAALKETFSFYSTEKAKTFFQEALDAIPPLEKSQQTLVDDILKQFRVRMRLAVLCLMSNPTLVDGEQQK